jgi:RNA polymerase sigma factor (sigma-70 family)
METLQHKTSYATDEEIIEKILRGETMLFEVLIRRYNSLLYKIARSCGFNHHDAEDLMQECHIAAFMYLKTFRREASYKTWLTKIHLNRCYHKLNCGHVKYEEASDELITDRSLFVEAVTENKETENWVINKELGKVLEESLQQIPLSYRSVFILREIEGFSVAETAELLGITPLNVKVRLNRSKAMLQKQLERFYSAADLYEFHLVYCDKIVKNVFERISARDIS